MQLLRHILREDGAFGALVVSDWGAVASRPAGVAAGLDLEMPSSGGINDTEVVRAVRSGAAERKSGGRGRAARAARGQTAMPCLWCAARLCRLRRTMRLLCRPRPKRRAFEKQWPAAAGQGRGRGRDWRAGRACVQISGAGSSFVNAARPESLLQALRAGRAEGALRAGLFGAAGAQAAPRWAARAVHLAKRARTVVYCMGLTDLYETEGYDRTHLRLPGNQLALLRRLAAVNRAWWCCWPPAARWKRAG